MFLRYFCRELHLTLVTSQKAKTDIDYYAERLLRDNVIVSPPTEGLEKTDTFHHKINFPFSRYQTVLKVDKRYDTI